MGRCGLHAQHGCRKHLEVNSRLCKVLMVHVPAAVTQVCVGLVTRDMLMTLCRQALGRGSTQTVDLQWEELNRRYVSPEGQRLVSEQQLAVLQVMPSLHFPS